jgi:hypothetical protein
MIGVWSCRRLQIPALQLPHKGQWVGAGAQGGNSLGCEATGVHKIPGVFQHPTSRSLEAVASSSAPHRLLQAMGRSPRQSTLPLVSDTALRGRRYRMEARRSPGSCRTRCASAPRFLSTTSEASSCGPRWHDAVWARRPRDGLSAHACPFADRESQCVSVVGGSTICA